jgi:hypothetical protein
VVLFLLEVTKEKKTFGRFQEEKRYLNRSILTIRKILNELQLSRADQYKGDNIIVCGFLHMLISKL